MFNVTKGKEIKNFTDRKLLSVIKKLYEKKFLEFVNNPEKKTFYIPIDCELIGGKMQSNGQMVFLRLYYFLEKKYGYKQDNGYNVSFFSRGIGDEINCINYPYMCAVLAEMNEKRSELNILWSLTIFNIIVTLVIGLLNIKFH